MPIGVPKVPFRHRSIDNTIVLSIHERLHLERTLFLSQKIEVPLVNRIISLLLYFDLQNDTDIFFYINCKGGEVLPTISLFDIIEFLFSDVCTTVTGLAASGASLILAAGTNPKRVAFPHARIMIRQPAPYYLIRGSAKEIQVEAEQMFELRNTFAEIYAKKTGQPLDVVQNDLERDTFMSAKEAQDYGIVDRIAKKVLKEKKKPPELF